MKHFAKSFIRFASLPIILLLCLGAFLLIYNAFALPDLNEIVAFARVQFEKHGYIVLFVSALLEGMLLINWFFPGTVVVVMGAIFAIQGAQSVFLSAATVFLGLFSMSLLNYFMGKYGWYRLLARFGLAAEIEKMKIKLEKHGLKILAITYFHPHVGALSATAAGILRIDARKFSAASFIVFAAWCFLWTALVYVFGEKLLSIINFKNLLIIVAAWIVFSAAQFVFKHLKQTSKKNSNIVSDTVNLEE